MNLHQMILKNAKYVYKAPLELKRIQENLQGDYLGEIKFLTCYATLPTLSEFLRNPDLHTLYVSAGTPVVVLLVKELTLFKEIPFTHWESARNIIITSLLNKLRVNPSLGELVDSVLKCMMFTQDYTETEMATIKTDLTNLVSQLLTAFRIYGLVDDTLHTTDLGARVVNHLVDAHSIALHLKNELVNASKV